MTNDNPQSLIEAGKAFKVVLGPNDEILSTRCDEVENVDGALIESLDKMMRTMNIFHGVGLAGPQVAIMKRIFVMGIPNDLGAIEDYYIINPVILEKDDKLSMFEEGCLSFPNLFVEIWRPKTILLKFLDRNGNERVREMTGLSATCAQHELDHVDGIVIGDHIKQEPEREEWLNKASNGKKELLSKMKIYC